MPIARNIRTGNKPLQFAESLTHIVNDSYNSGEMLEKVTLITKDLLRYWFYDTFTEARPYNFHSGQKQAILNTIFLHEVLKSKSVYDMYTMVDEDTLAEIGIGEIGASKYDYPKYCMKMATGTGKTWVMHALMIWQYLNSQSEEIPKNGRYSKNFLIVAPGLIVYERLLDAYLGKEEEDGLRNFETSDFYRFKELFIPESYENILFGFIQNSVAKKDEIGKKITGDGFIAITNWHLLAGVDEEDSEDDDPFENPMAVVKDLLPIAPGITAGHTLESLDNKYFRGNELEYLSKLKDIVVINDEAHHIHEVKTASDVIEVEWQKSLNKIAKNKPSGFIQIDFSATPYNVTGSGQKRTRHYFPHIIVNFDLKTAIHKGLVKTIVLDRRKEIASQHLAELDYRAVREGNAPVALSEGQKIMLRAGLSKLKILDKQFEEFTKNDKSAKYPKMLIICEDTKVSPLVVDYLINYEGLAETDILRVDSDKKGSIPASEWRDIKRKLFNVDTYAKPKVIVSVLMLREGFDVNNICVIVPLRSSQAPILLEQIVGRGLRLMWRESDYEEIKLENRQRLLIKKQEPNNYFDILSIVEHPAFIEFYEDLLKDGLVGEASEMQDDRGSIVGDMIDVQLKPNYQEYDLFFPIITQDKEEILIDKGLTIENMQSYTLFPYEKLKAFTNQGGDVFYSQEITVKTTFGTYKVAEQSFNAKSYNEFIARMINTISSSIENTGVRKKERFPFMQVNTAKLAALIDKFVKTKLFNRTFNPLEDNNWRILLLKNSMIVEHIINEVSKTIYEMQNNIEIQDAVVLRHYFSEVGTMKMRNNYSITVAKSIYNRLPYPTNKGIFEMNFMEYFDCDAQVEALIKIKENYHNFAYLNYIRNDGMIARYFPDFIVKLGNQLFLVETKAEKDTDNANVISKKKSALEWARKINELNPSERMGCNWHYAMVTDSMFYQFKANGASAVDILNFARLKKADTTEGQMNILDMED